MPALDPFSPQFLLPAAAIMLVAGILKGSIGFGFPLVGVPALALITGTKSAIVIISVSILVSNAWLLVRRPIEPWIIRRFAPMIATIVPTTVAGSLLLSSIDGRGLSVFLGVIALTFALLSLARIELTVSPRAERWVSPVLGVVGGLLNGATSIPGPIFALYLNGIGLEKRVFVYAITLLFAAGNLVQVISYGALGLYEDRLLWGALLLLPVALAGQQVGFRIQDRLNPVAFRRLVVVVVSASSINLIGRGLGWF